MPSTHQSIVLDAPIDEVWSKFSDFHDMSWATNVITNVTKVGDREGGKIGAKRILNDVFHETLVEVDPQAYLLRYSIDDGPSPVSKQEVSNYFGAVKLSTDPANGGTRVEWSSTWDANTEQAVDFCHGIYLALLDDLAKSFS